MEYLVTFLVGMLAGYFLKKSEVVSKGVDKVDRFIDDHIRGPR